MRPTVFQRAELRDENDEIIQQGTYGKESALSNSTNDGWIDYVMNNLEALNNNATPLDSPAFTGTPTAPTPSSDDDSTQIATTEFVQNIKDDEVTRADEKYLPLSGGTLTGVVNGVTPPAGDDSKKLANTEFIQALANILVPTGCVQAFAGNTTPQGWLLCDGSAVSRTDYAALYAVIGDTYGAGDGSTTFNLPNLVDKFVEGSATSGTVKSAGLPNITGAVGVRVYGNDADSLLYSQSGAIEITSQSIKNSGPDGESAVSSNIPTLSFDASKSNSIYGNSTTVQPPALTMRYIIKY